jgi:hypothetical protein
MHEFKHGELKSGRRVKSGKVKSRKQAIAIALHEAGASKFDTRSEKKRSFAKAKRKEATGRTGQQEREGKSRVGARGKRESTPAMGGKGATKSARSRNSSIRKRTSSTRKRTARKSSRSSAGSFLSRLLPK